MDSVFHASFFIRPRKKDEKEDILAYILADLNGYFGYLERTIPNVKTTNTVFPIGSKTYSYFPESLEEEGRVKYFVIKLGTQSDLGSLGGILHSSSGVIEIPNGSYSMVESYLGYYIDHFSLADVGFRVHFFYMKREGMSSKDFILYTLKDYYKDCIVKEDIDISKAKVESFSRLLKGVQFTGVTTSKSPLRPSDRETAPEAKLKIEVEYDGETELLGFLRKISHNKGVANVMDVQECKMVINEGGSEKLLPVGYDDNPLEDILVKLKSGHIMYGGYVRLIDFKNACIRFKDNPDTIPVIGYRLSDNT